MGPVTQSVLRLATGWTVRRSKPGVGEIFRTCSDRPRGSPSLLYNGYRVFPGGKERPGHDADPSPASSAVGHERVALYFYSPYGPYGLYRASVPVQSLSACTESQCLYRVSVSLQSLSACIESQCLYRVSVPVQRCTLHLFCFRSAAWNS
jgi:hypothetical protein